MLFAGVCPTLAAIMSGVADSKFASDYYSDNSAHRPAECRVIPFPQAEATGFNLCDHLQRTALKHDAAEAGRSVVLYFLPTTPSVFILS